MFNDIAELRVLSLYEIGHNWTWISHIIKTGLA